MGSALVTASHTDIELDEKLVHLSMTPTRELFQDCDSDGDRTLSSDELHDFLVSKIWDGTPPLHSRDISNRIFAEISGGAKGGKINLQLLSLHMNRFKSSSGKKSGNEKGHSKNGESHNRPNVSITSHHPMKPVKQHVLNYSHPGVSAHKMKEEITSIRDNDDRHVLQVHHAAELSTQVRPEVHMSLWIDYGVNTYESLPQGITWLERQRWREKRLRSILLMQTGCSHAVRFGVNATLEKSTFFHISFFQIHLYL